MGAFPSGCADRRKVLRDPSTSNAPHIDPWPRKVPSRAALPLMPPKPVTSPTAKRPGMAPACLIQGAAVHVHIDSAHALAREGKELGCVEGRRVDGLRFREGLLAKRLEVQIDSLFRQLVVTGHRRTEIRRRHTHRRRQIVKRIRLQDDTGRFVHEPPDVAEVFVARERDGETVLALFVEDVPVRAARLVEQRAQAELLIAKFLRESLALRVYPDCVEVEGCETACSAGLRGSGSPST